MEAFGKQQIWISASGPVMVKTLEGPLAAPDDGYILHSPIRGEVWPIAKDIFEETYDIVDD
jgi:hypothetical protein